MRLTRALWWLLYWVTFVTAFPFHVLICLAYGARAFAVDFKEGIAYYFAEFRSIRRTSPKLRRTP